MSFIFKIIIIMNLFLVLLFPKIPFDSDSGELVYEKIIRKYNQKLGPLRPPALIIFSLNSSFVNINEI